MIVVEYADAPTLWHEAEAFLTRDPANNTHQLSAIKRILDLGARWRAILCGAAAGCVGRLRGRCRYANFIHVSDGCCGGDRTGDAFA